MAKSPSFNFGFNKTPRAKKPRKSGTAKKGGKGKTGGGRGNAWRAYVGISNAPIPY